MNNTSIQTRFTKLFGIDYPIVSAPMFLVSDEKMVDATNVAGGMGAFPAMNYRPIEKLEEVLSSLSKKNRPYGVNIIVQKSNKYQHKQLDLLLKYKTPMIITSLGSPRSVIRRAHEAGTKVFCDVVNLEHAKKVADLGADGIVSVSHGAGGHGGDISNFALIPYLRKNLDIPILAAGNIVDGKGLAAALSLGADGIYMGTRFVASKEASVSDEYKKAIVKAGCESIFSTDKVDGFAGNFIKTGALKNFSGEKNLVEYLASKNKRVKRAISMVRAGRSLFQSNYSLSYKTVFSAGQGSGLIDEIIPIGDIIENVTKEYEDIKRNLP